MKGVTRITVTNQTAQEAFQEYFDKRAIGGADKVTWVFPESGSKFIIQTSEKEKEKEK